MDAHRRAVAAELLTASREHDAAQEDRAARYRNLETESAELLAVLARAAAPQHILELGTSNGYSTIWLADAAEAVGAQLTSVEIDAERPAYAGYWPDLLRALAPGALLVIAGLRVVVKDGRP